MTGQYISTLHNISKNKISYCFEPFNCVELEIPKQVQSSSLHLYDCLNNFIKNEKVTSTQYKSIHFWKLPNYLIIVLKRFLDLKKNTVHVTIPHLLNMENYCLGPEKNMEYKLTSICNHSGSVHGGHYYSFSFCNEKKKWYCCNDANIHEIKPNTVSTSQAYCLFYTKL